MKIQNLVKGTLIILGIAAILLFTYGNSLGIFRGIRQHPLTTELPSSIGKPLPRLPIQPTPVSPYLLGRLKDSLKNGNGIPLGGGWALKGWLQNGSERSITGFETNSWWRYNSIDANSPLSSGWQFSLKF